MALTLGKKDVIVRAYTVTLAPHGKPDLAFDSFSVTASYSADDPALAGEKADAHSAAAMLEVQRIANKIERRVHSSPEGTSYDLVDFKLTREFIVDKSRAR